MKLEGELFFNNGKFVWKILNGKFCKNIRIFNEFLLMTGNVELTFKWKLKHWRIYVMVYRMLEFLMISAWYLERWADMKMNSQLLTLSEFFMTNSIDKNNFSSSLHL